MENMVAPRPRYGQSTAPVHGRHVVQHALGAASRDAAHKQTRRGFEKAERVAQVLVLAGEVKPIVAHIARLQEIIADRPALELTLELRCDGKIDRAQDEARDNCLVDGCTTQEVDLLEARTLREIAQKYAVLRSIWGHRGAA